MSPTTTGKTYIVEHLDPELGAWSELEYVAIWRECAAGGSRFVLSSLPAAFPVPAALRDLSPSSGPSSSSFSAERRGVEEMYAAPAHKARVCLLDPAAETDLAPTDADEFDVFLFGGILGEYFLGGGERESGGCGSEGDGRICVQIDRGEDAHGRTGLTDAEQGTTRRGTARRSCATRASRGGDLGPSR